MGQLKELRDTILADITKDYLDTASDEFLSETELAGLERDADRHPIRRHLFHGTGTCVL